MEDKLINQRGRTPVIEKIAAASIRRSLVFDRQAIAPDRLGKEEVEPGDIISIWPWLLHRHAKLSEPPDAFDIDRSAQKGSSSCASNICHLVAAGGAGGQPPRTEALTILALCAERVAVCRGGQSGQGGRNGNVAAGGRLPLRLERRNQP